MIKINLIEKKKRQVDVVFAGVNVREIRWTPLILGVLWYTLELNGIFISLVLGTEEEEVKTKISELNEQKKKLTAEKVQLKSLDDEIKKFEIVEKKLQERLVAVREVIERRKNPQEIMLYISKTIPNDLWLDSFIIGQNEVEISGKASSYRSIGMFLESLRSSTFFDSDVRLASTSTEQEKESSRRNEVFKIQAKVSRFE